MLAPALRRTQCTTWWRGTPALLAFATHALSKFLQADRKIKVQSSAW
jgi:hypothetical protein